MTHNEATKLNNAILDCLFSGLELYGGEKITLEEFRFGPSAAFNVVNESLDQEEFENLLPSNDLSVIVKMDDYVEIPFDRRMQHQLILPTKKGIFLQETFLWVLTCSISMGEEDKKVTYHLKLGVEQSCTKMEPLLKFFPADFQCEK